MCALQRGVSTEQALWALLPERLSYTPVVTCSWLKLEWSSERELQYLVSISRQRGILFSLFCWLKKRKTKRKVLLEIVTWRYSPSYFHKFFRPMLLEVTRLKELSELEKEVRVRVMTMILIVEEIKILKPHVDDVEFPTSCHSFSHLEK